MRKLSGLIMLLLLSVVLVSCSVGEEDEPEPTEEPTEVPVSATISEEEEDTDLGMAGTPEFDLDADATPGAATVASPAVIDAATPADALIATPEGATMPPLAASPVATPQVGATPMASPDVDAAMIVPADPDATATPVLIEMTGTVSLLGEENETYVITDEGCVGLGQYEGLHDGQQVVIRDESGTITSVTTLEPAADADGCAWEFVASVPEAEFYSVSIPMVFEQVFPKAQVAENNGEVTIELP